MARQTTFAMDFASRRGRLERGRKGTADRRRRVYVLFGAAVVWLGLVGTRLASLQITDVDRWQEWALKQHFSEVMISSERGPILDRNNRLLAVSVPAGSIYVR